MKSMYIGSGDIVKLLAGKHTKGHQELLQRFVSDTTPHHNAKNSPIDAFRIGAILEDRFYLTLEDKYLPQYRAVCSAINVCRATLDFAHVKANQVVDFKELKTCHFTDFLNFQEIKNASCEEYIKFLKKNYKANYNQVQYQMMCAGINECTLVYLEVKNYNDADNLARIIQEEEYIEFRIKRDETVIELIKERASIFQAIKNHYKS